MMTLDHMVRRTKASIIALQMAHADDLFDITMGFVTDNIAQLRAFEEELEIQRQADVARSSRI